MAPVRYGYPYRQTFFERRTKNMRKRIWSLCMALVLCLGLLPYMTAPASAAASEISVGSVTLSGSAEAPAYATTDEEGAVTIDGAGEDSYNVKWDGSTLTLKDANIVASYDGVAYNPRTPSSLTITLDGENTISAKASGLNLFNGNLTQSVINGSGSLTVSGSSFGIRTKNDLTISGTEITAISEKYGSINANGNIEISNGATIHAQGSSGIYSLSGTVNISGKSNVTATGDYGIYATGGFHVQNSSVTAEGTDGNSIYAPYGKVAIEDSTVEAQGCIQDAIGFGTSDNGITISNSSVTVTGGQYGIRSSSGSVTISGDATDRVTAEGTDYGIFTYTTEDITISGGEVIAAGGTAALDSRFLYIDPQSGVPITVEAGEDADSAEVIGTYKDRAEITSSISETKYFHSETAVSPVTGVTVTPDTASVAVGGTQQFTAAVDGTDWETGDPVSQDVRWAVTGSSNPGTSISEEGLLTVAADETAERLTVKATSAQDSTKSDTAAVTVTHTHQGVLVEGKEATCTEDGVRDYYVCSICSKAFEDAECTIGIDDPDTWKVIPAAGHSWSSYQADDATNHSRTCTVCQEKETTAHDYTDDQDGSCNVCGYARWYTVTFDANEGSVSPASAKTENGKLSTLPTPTREGHVFTGWYTAKDGGELVTTGTVFSADTTLYARWRVKTPPVITVNLDPTKGGSCLVAEITSDMVGDLTQLDPKPLVNGTYTAKESGSTIILFPQAAPGYMIDAADYVKIPGEDEDTVSFDGPEDFSYISITTDRDLTVNLTFREASNLTVGDAILSNGPVCYATTDGSGHVTPQPGYTEASPWNVKWDSANSTLTLRNATIQGIVDGNGSSCGIFYEANLSIVLEGTNRVTGADVGTTNGSAMSIGIYGKGKLSFSGSGSLTAAAGKSASSVGIAAEGALTFGDRVKVEASGADVSVTGDVDVSSIKWGGQSAGVFSAASIAVQDEADVTATGGHYQVSESGKTNIGFSTGCQTMQVSVQGGKLTAMAQKSANDWFGIEAYTVTVSGGEIDVRGNPVFYWENSEEEDLRCVFTVVPPAGKLCHVETGSGESLTEIAGSPFTAETALDTSLFKSDTAFHCYLADDPTHQHTYDQWKYDETNHWHACVCGESQGDAAPHVYDSAADLTCDVCGYERTVATYSVSVSASPAEGGSVTGSGTYIPGTSVQLTAAANSGYHFVKWNVLSGNITISSNAFTMPAEAVEIQAVFAQDSSGGGSGGSGGGSSGTHTYSISLPDSMTGGKIKLSSRYAEEGDTVTLTVTPDEGYVLDTLTVTDSKDKVITLANKGNGKYTFTMPGSRVTVDAVFVKSTAALPFTDVGESYWAYDEIVWAWEKGYMSGTSAASFNPGGTVSRQQVWMILARLAGENPAGMAEAKAWAMANGISDGTNPGAPVTRQQLAALLYRYAVQYGYDVSVGENTNLLSFTDFADLSEYAVPAMQWACGAGIINGTGDGSALSPQGTATRAQLAVMLYRWLA